MPEPGRDAHAESAVRALLGIAGLPATEHEVALLAGQYPAHLAAVDTLYAVATDCDPPALVFDAAPTFTDWAEST